MPRSEPAGSGSATPTARPQLLIVDGQQRLTSLYAVLTGQPVLTKAFEEKRIRIAFNPIEETFEVTDAAIEKNPEFIPDITALWSDGYRVDRPHLPQAAQRRARRCRSPRPRRTDSMTASTASMTCGTSGSRSSS